MQFEEQIPEQTILIENEYLVVSSVLLLMTRIYRIVLLFLDMIEIHALFMLYILANTSIFSLLKLNFNLHFILTPLFRMSRFYR